MKIGFVLTGNGRKGESMIECIVEMLKENDPQPRVVQEIVRCKDCIHWDDHLEECSNSDSVCFRNGMTGADWFCADGERKEG